VLQVIPRRAHPQQKENQVHAISILATRF